MFSREKREFYLCNQWRSYPTTAIDFSEKNPIEKNNKKFYAGRIVSFVSTGLQVSLSNAQIVTLEFIDGVSIGVFEMNSLNFKAQTMALEVLQVGDIVMLSAEERRVHNIQLLVPSQRDNPLREFNSGLVAKWSEFLKVIRDYFIDKEFFELSTPSLVESPGMEPYLESFEVAIRQMSASEIKHLPTSPELHIKKALSQFSGTVFEIKRCFRNNELGHLHQPEFLMLEWYRSFSTLEKIAEDLEGLVSQVFDNQITFERSTFHDIFVELFDFQLNPETEKNELLELCRSQKIHFQQDDQWDDLFNRLFLEKIEPWLAKKPFMLIRDFPPQQMSLAKNTDDGWSDRFELYANGVELANAFQELNDAKEQKKRIDQANKMKERLGLPKFPVDLEFLKTLEYGMPPSAGIALGLERLFMVRHGIEDIKKAVLFAHDL